MSTSPTDPTPAPIIPTEAHRLATDRAMRLAAHAGPGEALEFFDELSAGERRIVFAMLARVAGRRRLPPAPDDVPWWTATELEAAHKAVVTGARAPWLLVASRIWRTQQARTAKAIRALTVVPS